MKFLKFIFIFFLFHGSLYGNEFRISMENDILFENDSNYTHGTWISYSFFPKEASNNWLLNERIDYKRISFGQYMYTPQDISIEELIENDRPYAGVLYSEYAEYMEGDDRMKSLSLVAGVLGSLSLADETQIFIHDTFGATDPKGWDHQLSDEPILNVSYADRHRLFYRNYFDLLSGYTVALGSLNTHASLHVTCKFGYNVPKNYGIVRLEPVPAKLDIFNYDSKYIYGFISLEGKAVARNATLDGNMFSDSHSVEKENFVGDFIFGFASLYRNFEISIYSNLRTKEFEGQHKKPRFSGLTVAYKL